MSKVCPICGKENSSGAKFCGSCGFHFAGGGRNHREPSSDGKASGEPLPGRPADPEATSDYQLYKDYDSTASFEGSSNYSHDQGSFQGSSQYGPGQSPSGPSGGSFRPGSGAYPPPGPAGPHTGPAFEGGGYGGYPPDPGAGGDKGSKTQKLLLLFAALIAIAIIGLSAFLILSGRYKDDKTAEETSSDQKTQAGGSSGDSEEIEASTDQSQETDSAEEDTLSPVSTDEEQVTTEAEEVDSNLAYCDNGMIDLLAHKQVSDFQTMTSKDGSFRFSYPKHIFNHSEANEDGSLYFFSYVNDDGEEIFSLKYTKTYEPGDPKKIVLAAQKEYMNRFVKTDYNPDYERDENNGHQHVAIATGDLNMDGSKGEYALVENDGEYTCRMELIYPEYHGEEKDYLQYIINNVYRLCSFSYTRKNPVSYKEMVKEGIFD